MAGDLAVVQSADLDAADVDDCRQEASLQAGEGIPLLVCPFGQYGHPSLTDHR
jgi:hypothetical protein